MIEHCREIAKEIVAADPELSSAENVLMAKVLKRMKKSQYDWSSIS